MKLAFSLKFAYGGIGLKGEVKIDDMEARRY